MATKPVKSAWGIACDFQRQLSAAVSFENPQDRNCLLWSASIKEFSAKLPGIMVFDRAGSKRTRFDVDQRRLTSS
jgi:hypothetical protein